MKKKVKIHMLPTGDITGIVLHSTGLDKIIHTKESELNAVLNIGGTSQHLYFTSDEKIEEGDWALYLECGTNDEPLKDAYPYLVEFPDESHWNDRKIVATTDKSLYNPKTIQYGNMLLYDINNDGSFYYCIDCEVSFSLSRDGLIQRGLIVPQIPQSFIKEYVKSGGKIDEVEIEYTDWCDYDDDNTWGGLDQADLRIKVDSNNCVIIHTVKDSWSREEVIKILKNFEKYLEEYPSARTSIVRVDNWIKENL